MTEQPYATIVNWAVVECAYDGKATQHIVGYTAAHGRFGGGCDPYIGSALTRLDLEKRQARNSRGLLIVLEGDPQPKDEPLPGALQYMMSRAEFAWGLDGTTVTWTRVD